MADEDIALLFTNVIPRDLFYMVAGGYLGGGDGREVYEFRVDCDYVIKFESTSYSFQNVHEWDVWQAIKGTEFAKWFAPCKMLSPCGTVLIQRRTKQPLCYPGILPNFFTDTRKDNFGVIGDQFVCHDYGITLLMEKGMSKRMKKVKWR